MLSKRELFSRLAEGHAAGVTVVTPNARLAQALLQEFDFFQKSKTAWEAADILPLGAFAQRLWDEAFYAAGGGELPLVLTGAQEQLVWEEILAQSGLLAVPQAAAQCREAWRLMHQWRVAPAGGNEDVEAFDAWRKEYERRTQGYTDGARLPDLRFLSAKPKLLVAYGFDLLPPQARDFLARFDYAECKPAPVEGADARRTSFPSPAHELEAAARWARARLEAGAGRIGVVVPGLETRRREVIRIFARVLGARAAFNLSLGVPLAEDPVVDAAIALLELALGEVPFGRASRLLRSPFLAGGAEGARFRRRAPAMLSLPKLIAFTEGPARRKLEAVFELSKASPKTPADCARHFSALLEAAGFAKEGRALDSAEFQALGKWHEMLFELARLERFAPRMAPRFAPRMEPRFALGRLKRLCADTLFQPESPDAPIQVLGILEATGLRFDALWVSGLTDERWPIPAAPNPFLAVGAQRAAGIPQASAEESLALDRRLTEEWRTAAKEVVFSWPARDGDKDLAASPLILPIEAKPVGIPRLARHRDLVFAAQRLEAFEDVKAPALETAGAAGGTRVLADQAACPFRAFARWRLGAKALEEPVPGGDARTRGTLLHALMKHLWTDLRGSASLSRNLDTRIEKAANAAVEELGLEGRFAELERERLARVAAEWLEIERQRAPFEVAAVEEKTPLELGGLALSGRIDRMDRLEGGGHVLIDFKSGEANPKDWAGPRPAEPQMPVYAVTSAKPIAAVVFASLKRGKMRFRGYAEAEDLLPGVKPPKEIPWRRLLAAWRKEAETLAGGLRSGDARVDPKAGRVTCRLCDLQPLCRVHERAIGAGGDYDDG